MIGRDLNGGEFLTLCISNGAEIETVNTQADGSIKFLTFNPLQKLETYTIAQSEKIWQYQ